MVARIIKEQIEEAPESATPGINISKMKFTPWPGRILLKRADPDAVTRGGIHLPQTSLETKAYGKVVSVGQGCENVQVGSIILFIEDCGVAMPMLGDGYALLESGEGADSDILGTFCEKT